MKRRIITFAPIFAALMLVACSGGASVENTDRSTGKQSVELSYAKEYSMYEESNGAYFVSIRDQGDFLLVQDDNEASLEKDDIQRISVPMKNAYVAASQTMDLFCRLDALDNVSMVGTKEEDWEIPSVKDAMKTGGLSYAGRYSMPDYEMILESDCTLAIENTMIYHSPKVREELMELGIPVLVDHSSREGHPLGRLEWIKLYGRLTGRTDEADEIFDEQRERYENVLRSEPTGKRVAFFAITSQGLASIRRPGDYISRMIEDAGGSYAFDDTFLDDESSRATANIDMETFYSAAKDCDIIIYNSTIEGAMDSVNDLTAKNDLFSDFKAVKEGRVYCTRANVFQEMGGVADILEDLHAIITNSKITHSYFYALR